MRKSELRARALGAILDNADSSLEAREGEVQEAHEYAVGCAARDRRRGGTYEPRSTVLAKEAAGEKGAQSGVERVKAVRDLER